MLSAESAPLRRAHLPAVYPPPPPRAHACCCVCACTRVCTGSGNTSRELRGGAWRGTPGEGPLARADGPDTFRLPPPRGRPGAGSCLPAACRAQGERVPGPAPHSHQQQLVALTEACLLGQGARLDRVHEAPACVAPEQGQLRDEAVAGQRGVLHGGPGTPHVPHGRDRRPEGSASGNNTGVRRLESGRPCQGRGGLRGGPLGCPRPGKLHQQPP